MENEMKIESQLQHALSEHLFQLFASVIGARFAQLKPCEIDSEKVESLLLQIRLASTVALARIGAPTAIGALIDGLNRDKNEVSLRTLVEVAFLDSMQVDFNMFKKGKRKR